MSHLRPPRRIILTGFMGAGKTTIALALARLLRAPCLDLDDMIAAREGRTPQAIIEEEGEARFRQLETHLLAELLEDAPVKASEPSVAGEAVTLGEASEVSEASEASEISEASESSEVSEISEVSEVSEASATNSVGRADEPASESYAVIALGGGAWTIEENRALIAAHDCLCVWLDAPFELCWQRINAGTTDGQARPLARTREEAERLYAARRALYALAHRRVGVDAGRSDDEMAAEIRTFLNFSGNESRE